VSISGRHDGDGGASPSRGRDRGAGDGDPIALAIGLGSAMIGIGVALFRERLIMTLGSRRSLGLLTVQAQKHHRWYRALPCASARALPDLHPARPLVWAPVSALIILGLRYSGTGA
jgi:hypothetical protein